MPYPTEVSLRMLLGGAACEAAMLGFHIAPVFSPITRTTVQFFERWYDYAMEKKMASGWLSAFLFPNILQPISVYNGMVSY